MELYYMTARELQRRIQQREISITELVQAQLERVHRVEDQIHSYISICQEEALVQAKALDQRLADGSVKEMACGQKRSHLGGIYGIPIAYKDNICTQEVATTCASKMLVDFVPPYSATAVERLQQGGAIMLGKTNLDEFAMGSSTENSAFFPTHNPWDRSRVPGGSSGGSAAAVAAGEAVISLGSDTGGSVRQPAAFCGVVGMKPTYGLVSRFGLIAYASSMDHIGPITRDVTDCALVLNVIAGDDPKDATTARGRVEDYTEALVPGVKGIKIGVPMGYFSLGIQIEIVAKIQEVIQRLVRLGAEVEEFAMEHLESALATYYMLAPAEASSNLARFDGVRYGFRAPGVQSLDQMYRTTRGQGFGSEVKQRILLGTHVLSSGYYEDYYLKAQKVRTLIKEDFDQAFEKYDILITPTTPNTANPMGQQLQGPWSMYRTDLCTVAMNLAGVPAISIPVGFDSNGLPIGMQIVGKHFAEKTILQVAYTVEQELQLGHLHPVLAEEQGAE